MKSAILRLMKCLKDGCVSVHYLLVFLLTLFYVPMDNLKTKYSANMRAKGSNLLSTSSNPFSQVDSSILLSSSSKT